MHVTGPIRAHPDIRRRRVIAAFQVLAGAGFGAIGVLGLLDEEVLVLRAIACCVMGVLGVVAGVSGVVTAASRAGQAASMRRGGTIGALPVRERQAMDNGGWTFVCDHGGAEHVLTIQGEDGWPVLAGPGDTHLGVVQPASGAAPVAFTESGFPFDLRADALRDWTAAARTAAGPADPGVPPIRGKLPYSAKSSGGIGPMTIVGFILCALVLVCGGDVLSILGAAAAAVLAWLLVRTLRAVRSVDVRDHEIAWKRRAGGGRIAWSDVGGVAVRAKMRASRGAPSSADIATGASGLGGARIAVGLIVGEDDATAPERAASSDPILARLEHIGSRNQRREPAVTIYDRSGAVVLRAVGGLPWRLARVLASEAVARGVPLR